MWIVISTRQIIRYQATAIVRHISFEAHFPGGQRGRTEYTILSSFEENPLN